MPIYYDRSRSRWRYEFSRVIDGRRIRHTKLLPAGWTRDQAESYAVRQDQQRYAVATGSPKVLIEDAVDLYLKERAPHLKGRKELERDLRLLRDWYTNRYTYELPEVARLYARESRCAPATVKVRLAYLRSACRWAWKHHNLGDSDPGARVVLPTVKNERHQYVTRRQLLQIAKAITDRNARAVVLVAFYSGMRLGEVLRARATESGWLLDDTKNGDRRLIPIHPKVGLHARRWPVAISARSVQYHFKTAARAVGLRDLRFHDLRHSAASAMVNAGVPLFTVGAVLGHRSAASTKRYAHLQSSVLAHALQSIR